MIACQSLAAVAFRASMIHDSPTFAVELACRTFDVFSESKAIYVGFSGRLHRAQIDAVEF